MDDSKSLDPDTKQRSVDDIARGIAVKVYETVDEACDPAIPLKSWRVMELIEPIIAAALREYGEECVLKAFDNKFKNEHKRCLEIADATGYRRGVEEMKNELQSCDKYAKEQYKAYDEEIAEYRRVLKKIDENGKGVDEMAKWARNVLQRGQEGPKITDLKHSDTCWCKLEQEDICLGFAAGRDKAAGIAESIYGTQFHDKTERRTGKKIAMNIRAMQLDGKEI